MLEKPNYLNLPGGVVLKDRYEIKKCLSRESDLSLIYLAHDIAKKQEVVIKEFFPRKLFLRDMEGRQAVLKEKSQKKLLKQRKGIFFREAILMDRFCNSNIVEFKNYFKENNTSYIVMKYYKGPNLREYIKNRDIELTDFLEKIIFPLLEACKSLHHNDYLHGDIKPDNVIISNQGPILLDLGSMINYQSEVKREVFVSPGFSPLEFYSFKSEKGPFSDIYSFSALIYYYLTGREPVPARARLFSDNLKPVEHYNDTISSSLNDFIERNLSLESEKRDKEINKFKTKLLIEFYKMKGKNVVKKIVSS